MHNPDRLQVLQRARRLNIALHKHPLRGIGRRAPGLRNQLLRAVNSIPTNITEGLDAGSPRECARFLTIAIGSANEAEQHLRLANELSVLGANGDSHVGEVVEIRRMLFGLRKRILDNTGGKRVGDV